MVIAYRSAGLNAEHFEQYLERFLITHQQRPKSSTQYEVAKVTARS
jgi:hypothetical protein